MKRSVLIIVGLLVSCSFFTNYLLAETIGCCHISEDDFASEGLPDNELEGTCRALVIAGTCPDDIENGWVTLDMPTWLTDSFISPTIDSITHDKYKWSISNFLYAASHGAYKFIGEVNPGNNGQFFVSDDTLMAYEDDDSRLYVEHILKKADSVINYSEYDSVPAPDGDGAVDFVIFLLPRTPRRYNPQETYWPMHKACYGKSWLPLTSGNLELDSVEITSSRGVRGSVTIFRYDDPPGSGQNWDTVENFSRDPQVNLAAHEIGHRALGLTDWYAAYDNLYQRSYPLGWYSVMQLARQPHALMYCTPQLAESAPSSWTDVIEVNNNWQNVQLFDMLESGQILKLPVAENESFYISAHLQTSDFSHWEELMGGLENNNPDQPRASEGVLIWHTCTRNYTHPNGYRVRFGSYKGTVNELAIRYDLECAEGKWLLTDDLDSISGFQGFYPESDPVDPTPQPEFGFDRLNFCSGCGYKTGWDEITGYGETTNPNDFFRQGWMGAFTSLTNPSSDAYNDDALVVYEYPPRTGNWEVAIDSGFRQNIATHISIEGIHDSTSNSVALCIRRSRIWSDSSNVMDRTTQRKFIYSNGDYHFVYPSKGYIYHTSSDAPHQYWGLGVLLGNGRWPAMALDTLDRRLFVWHTPADSIYYKTYHPNLADYEATLNIPGTPGPIAIDYSPISAKSGLPGAVPGDTTVQLVHLSYIIEEDTLKYAYFPLTSPENLAEEVIDDTMIDCGTRVIGASIAVSDTFPRVCVAYGCIKPDDTAACFYNERSSSGWKDSVVCFPFRLWQGFTNSLLVRQHIGKKTTPIWDFVKQDDTVRTHTGSVYMG